MLIVPVERITFATFVVGLLIVQSLIVTDEPESASIAGWVVVAPVTLHSVINAVPSKKLIAFPTVPVILQLYIEYVPPEPRHRTVSSVPVDRPVTCNPDIPT